MMCVERKRESRRLYISLRENSFSSSSIHWQISGTSLFPSIVPFLWWLIHQKCYDWSNIFHFKYLECFFVLNHKFSMWTNWKNHVIFVLPLYFYWIKILHDFFFKFCKKHCRCIKWNWYQMINSFIQITYMIYLIKLYITHIFLCPVTNVNSVHLCNDHEFRILSLNYESSQFRADGYNLQVSRCISFAETLICL